MFKTLLLLLEFLVVFIGTPLLMAYRLVPNLPIPYLMGITVGAVWVLRRDQSFDLDRLISPRGIAANLPLLLLRDVVLLIFLALAVRMFAPELLFSLIKRSPALWVLIMVLYPLLSVYPQELLYRAYFFHRYRPLFGTGWPMFVASAGTFGFAHVIFGNWIAIVLCTIGGLLFALTYESSGSLLLACIDHTLFGNFLFTIGLGRFFYHGARL